MLQFALLIALYIFYIYIIERIVRHTVQGQIMGTLDERQLLQIRYVANVFCNKNAWSNFILVIGTIIATGLFVIDIKWFVYKTIGGGIFTSLALVVSFISISIAATFSGKTWIKKIYDWLFSFSETLIVKIFKRLFFEILLIVFLVFLFLAAVFIGLVSYMKVSDSIISLKLIFYFLPIFFVLWIYRIEDYDEFEMNISPLS